MTLIQRTILLTVAGMLAGLLIWFALDQTQLLLVLSTRMHDSAHPSRIAHLIGCLAGGIFGLLLGMADAMTVDLPLRRLQAACLSLFAGIAGGAAAIAVSPIFPTDPTPVLATIPREAGIPQSEAPATFLQYFLPFVAWCALSTAIAIVPALVRRSFRLGCQIAAGGIAGAIFASALWQFGQSQPQEASIGVQLIAAASCALAGAFMSFGQAAAPYLFRRASVLVTDGAGKGREHFIARKRVYLGSGANCDIVVSRDRRPGIVAVIEDDGVGYRLSPSKEAEDAAWERREAPKRPARICDGDMVEIGDCVVRFTVAHGSAGAPNRITDWHALPPGPRDADSPAGQVARSGDGDQRGVFKSRDLLMARSARLLCVSGPLAGSEFALPPGVEISLGRGVDQDVSVPDDSAASRAHASIVVLNGHHMVRDNGSANGTYLNGNSVTTPRRIFPGDFIQIGRTEFVYEADAPQDETDHS